MAHLHRKWIVGIVILYNYGNSVIGQLNWMQINSRCCSLAPVKQTRSDSEILPDLRFMAAHALLV